MAQFIGLQKLAVGGLTELSVDRPVDRQRSEIRPLGQRSTGPVDRASGTENNFSVCRPSGRPGFSREQKLSGGRPSRSTGPPVHKGVHVCARRSTDLVDRLQLRSTGRSTEARIQRAQLSVRSTGRSTGAFPESRALWTVDRVGRPALLPELACTSVDQSGRPTSGCGRPSGRPAEARQKSLGDLKLGLFG